MPDASIGTLEPYIASVGEASKRSRWSLLVLIVASIFGCASFLSAHSAAWPWRRLELLETTWRCVAAAKAPGHSSCTEEEAERAGQFLLTWRYTTTEVNNLNDLSKLIIDDSALNHHVQHQRDIIMDRISSQTVPVLGFSFDVNDLGTIAALSFTVMLLVLALALRRERQNVQLLRSHAIELNQQGGESALRRSRDLVYMRQVFSIISNVNADNGAPPSGGFGRLMLWLAGRLHLLIIWFPVIVEAAITAMDLTTVSIGWAISIFNTILLFSFEGLGLLTSLVLAGICHRELRALDREFEPSRWKSPNKAGPLQSDPAQAA